MPVETASQEYYPPTRLLFIHNEHSSHAERTAETMARIRATGWPIGEVLTDRDQTVTQDRMAEHIRPGDALVASGGDGTVNAVLNATYDLGLLRHYVLAEKAGNACDSARNLHGEVPLGETLERGRPVAAYALKTMIEFADGTRFSRYAASYTGIGGAGAASVDLDRIKRSPLHSVLEPLVAWRAIGRHPYFRVHDTGKPHAAPDIVTDMSVAIGDIIAKYGHTGADIFSGDARLVLSRQRGMIPALGRMIQLRSGTLQSSELVRPVRYEVETEETEGILVMYHDGETILIPSGSYVTIGVEPKPYRTLRS